MRTIATWLGWLSLLMLIAGIVMKYASFEGANNLTQVGLFLLTFVYAPLFLKVKLSEEPRKDARISYLVFFCSAFLVLVSSQFRILHLQGAQELTYLSLLIFVAYMIYFSSRLEGRKLKLQKDRQLAAILFTDIVGYTRMMAADEDSTLQILETNRKVHKRWIRKFRGKYLKEMGDGSIAIFYTATEAVRCALEIQDEAKAMQRFEIRMGIHISEIVFTDEDAFGDGMNVASRIAGVAQGGEICISDNVYENIRNREQLRIRDLGMQELKNVGRPIHIYSIKTLTLEKTPDA
ncbi:MAG: adenylate/guanylate cyclase domain-containing protein [Cyclobacteriaceae bacterium]